MTERRHPFTGPIPGTRYGWRSDPRWGGGIPGSFRINNEIKSSVSICPVSENGVVTIFTPKGSDPAGQIEIPAGISPTYRLNLAAIGGLGIQVNLWYWAREPDIPIQKGPRKIRTTGGSVHIHRELRVHRPGCLFRQGKEDKQNRKCQLKDGSRHLRDYNCTEQPYRMCHPTLLRALPPLSGWDNVCRQGDYYKSVCTPPWTGLIPALFRKQAKFSAASGKKDSTHALRTFP